MQQEGEMPAEYQPAASSKREGGRNLLQQKTETAHINGTGTMKVESGVQPSPSHGPELQFLRSRVRELEREKAEMAAENQRLKNMLVNEIPGLLSTMWQSLGQTNHDPVSHQSISAVTGGYGPYSHHHPGSIHSAQDGGFSPPGSLHHPPMSNHSEMDEEDLSGDLSHYGAPVSGSEDDVNGGDLGIGSDLGEEVPLCSQPDMPEMRTTCSEAQCVHGEANSHVSHVEVYPGSGVPLCSQPDMPEMRTACSEAQCVHGDANSHVSHAEVYPGSGVLCDVRSWHAANHAQSPTAMARTLLLGVFDMDTLMSSNLRGGRSRRPAFHPQRSALDPHKINAIFNATLARFPLARKGVIGTGINSKLSEIRFRSRRAQISLRDRDRRQEREISLRARDRRQEREIPLRDRDGLQEREIPLRDRDGLQEREIPLRDRDGLQERDIPLRDRDGRQEREIYL